MSSDKNEDIVRKFLSLHEPDTFEQQLDLLHDDCLFEVPFRNVRIVGKETIVANSKVGMNLRNWTKATFVDVKIMPAEDAGTFVVESGGDMILPNGAEYKNRYVFIVGVKDDRIALFREYFNPDVLTAALV